MARADLVFRSSGTRAEGRIDLGTDFETPNITLDPAAGTVDVGGGDPSMSGRVRVRSPTSSTNTADEVVGELGGDDVDENAGTMRLWEQPTSTERNERLRIDASVPGSDIDDDPDPVSLDIIQGETAAASIEATEQGGRLTLFDPGRTAAVLTAEARGSGEGVLTLSGDQGRETIRARGGEGTLVLSGPPESLETGDQGGDVASEYGGGELVVEEWQSSGDRDIHFHATGEQVSDYGVGAGNRPRIVLDGDRPAGAGTSPEAVLELGRQELGVDRAAVAGGIVLRDDDGRALLELDAAGGNGFTAGIALYWSDGSTREPRGEIRASPDGLTIYDAGGRRALVITPQNEVETRRSVERL